MKHAKGGGLTLLFTWKEGGRCHGGGRRCLSRKERKTRRNRGDRASSTPEGRMSVNHRRGRVSTGKRVQFADYSEKKRASRRKERGGAVPVRKGKKHSQRTRKKRKERVRHQVVRKEAGLIGKWCVKKNDLQRSLKRTRAPEKPRRQGSQKRRLVREGGSPTSPVMGGGAKNDYMRRSSRAQKEKAVTRKKGRVVVH